MLPHFVRPVIISNILRRGRKEINRGPFYGTNIEGTGGSEVRNSSVGIATRYGPDGPGIGSRWGREFSHPSKTGPGNHPTSYTIVPGLFKGQSGRDVALTTHPI